MNCCFKMAKMNRTKSGKQGAEPYSVVQKGPALTGVALLRDPARNKGQAFTIKERQLLGVHGLLPPVVRTTEHQINYIMQNVNRYDNDLDKYIFLIGLQDRNEKLFYKVMAKYTEELMPIIYTPTVGLACQKYGLIFRKPRGLFITKYDKGHIEDILCNWPEQKVKAICVTDGERILGLGDLGAYGMGIPVGKLSLYTALAGVRPDQCLPITLDVGTNNQALIEDPLYIGLREARLKGEEYDEFVDEFMEAVVRRYGQGTLIQFEDFGNHNAFRYLEKYKFKYCTFNDDIQGTASVCLAGVIAGLRISGKKMKDNTFLFQGAGEAAIGIAKLIVMHMMEEGITEDEAIGKIWMVDSRGLIVQNRPKGGLTEEKVRWAKNNQPIDTLEEVVNFLKPTAIIGVAAVAGAFSKEIILKMAEYNDRPMIFALSNPTSKAECTAEQAYTLTEGRCIFASGSPFAPVTYKGKTYVPGQGNNSYIFPGVGLAIVACGIRHVEEMIFLKAAQSLAELVTEDNLKEGRVYPPLQNITNVSVKIATKIADYVYATGQAAHYPEPNDKETFIRSQMYSTEYESFIPSTYDWPAQHHPACKI